MIQVLLDLAWTEVVVEERYHQRGPGDSGRVLSRCGDGSVLRGMIQVRNDPGDEWWCKWDVKIKVCAVTDSVMGGRDQGEK